MPDLRCPLASHSGTEWVWESGTSWQRAPHQRTPKEKETHTCIHTSSSIVLPPCEPLLAPVTHTGLGLQSMNEGWVLGGSAPFAPWSGPTLELTLCFWELPGAAKRDRWAALLTAGQWAGDVSPVIDELTQRPLLHGSNWCTLTIKPPYCPEEATCLKRKGERDGEQTFGKLSRCWKAAAWESRLHWVFCCSSLNLWKCFTAAQ